MTFRLLQQQLLAYLRARVCNGEITERGLAHLTGLSQPHLHNALKGARSLSMEMADQIVERLQINLVELASESVEGEDRAKEYGLMAGRSIPWLEGAIGPGHPYPQRESRQSAYVFQAADLHGLESPVAAWLVGDPQVMGCMGQGGVLLLDRSERRRTHPDRESYYALDLGGESSVGRVEIIGERLYLRSQEAGDAWWEWRSISLADRPLLEVVKGRVHLLVVHW